MLQFIALSLGNIFGCMGNLESCRQLSFSWTSFEVAGLQNANPLSTFFQFCILWSVPRTARNWLKSRVPERLKEKKDGTLKQPVCFFDIKWLFNSYRFLKLEKHHSRATKKFKNCQSQFLFGLKNVSGLKRLLELSSLSTSKLCFEPPAKAKRGRCKCSWMHLMLM